MTLETQVNLKIIIQGIIQGIIQKKRKIQIYMMNIRKLMKLGSILFLTRAKKMVRVASLKKFRQRPNQNARLINLIPRNI